MDMNINYTSKTGLATIQIEDKKFCLMPEQASALLLTIVDFMEKHLPNSPYYDPNTKQEDLLLKEDLRERLSAKQ